MHLKEVIYKTHPLLFVIIVLCLFICEVKSQVNDPSAEMSCVKLKLSEQKALTKSKKKLPKDVVIFIPDDIASIFQLTNNCDDTIYYLVSVNTQTPVGFMLHRKKDGNWEARSPAWGRSGIFTDEDNYS